MIPEKILNDGHTLPVIGLGTYALRGDSGVREIGHAIDSGYRLIDTASRYENEREVGEAIRLSGVPREEFRVTSKVRGKDQGYEETLKGFETTLGELGLDYLDLYLIHWPLPRIDKYRESWKAMIHLRDSGRIRSIGVSNFTDVHIQRLIDETGVIPAINQIELHPFFPQTRQLEWNTTHGIVTESWCPLGNDASLFLENEVIAGIASTHGVTPARVVLKWHIQRGAVPIPKAARQKHQKENLEVFGWELDESELKRITDLENRRVWGSDPDFFEEL